MCVSFGAIAVRSIVSPALPTLNPQSKASAYRKATFQARPRVACTACWLIDGYGWVPRGSDKTLNLP